MLRFGPDQGFDEAPFYLQRVDLEGDAYHLPLVNPIAVAADSQVVYVADGTTGQVVYYKRRP